MNAAALSAWFSAEQLASLGGKLTIDSRQVQAGDWFVLCPPTGEHLTAERQTTYAQDACARGATAVLLDAAAEPLACAAPIYRIENLKAELPKIAASYWQTGCESLRVLGVTGTNGKTTCANWYAELADRLVGRAGVIGTLGAGLAGESAAATGFTTPDVLNSHRLLAELKARGAEVLAMEVSSHALDQGRIDGIAVDTAIFTNLTRDHLDYHGGMAEYAQAKLALFKRPELKLAVINIDDAYGGAFAQQTSAELLTYAIDDQSADLHVTEMRMYGGGLSAHIVTPWGEGELVSRFPGRYNVLNLLAVIAALCGRGADFKAVLAAVAELGAVPGRSQVVSSAADEITVVVDFAHTPDALANVLAGLRHGEQPLWCVFGCGGDRDRGKRPQMAAVAEELADFVILTSDNPRSEAPEDILAEVAAGLSGKTVARVIVERAQAIFTAVLEAPAGAIVVIAGKGHEDYQEIKGVKHHFNDAEQAQMALKLRAGAANA